MRHAEMRLEPFHIKRMLQHIQQVRRVAKQSTIRPDYLIQLLF